MENIIDDVLEIHTMEGFEKTALKVFQYQYLGNPVYKRYVDLLEIIPEDVKCLKDIPCMPVEFYKTHKVMVGEFSPELEFQSSGTGNQIRSKHYVKDSKIYDESLLHGFKLAYGEPSEYAIFALLPSYLERGNASLVYMVEKLKAFNLDGYGGFYLDEYEDLESAIKKAKVKYKVLLIGVSFALLDFAEKRPQKLSGVRIIETGGMKGRRKEITREELREIINTELSPDSIDSEYGMTELLSQAWAINDSEFTAPPWMKVFIRDMQDPRAYVSDNTSGLINVIDLANIYSCAFIETKDIGKSNAGKFKVLGRLDNSDIRGCNLMI